MSGTTGRPAEVLRGGGGIKVAGTAGDGRAMSTHIRDAQESPLAKGLPRLIYHRRALSNELLLRAVTGTSFFTKRVLGYVLFLVLVAVYCRAAVARSFCGPQDIFVEGFRP